MPINRKRRRQTAATQYPLLGYINKGLTVGNSAMDTNGFLLTPNPKLFAPDMVKLILKAWAGFHGVTPLPDNPTRAQMANPDNPYVVKVLEGVKFISPSFDDGVGYEVWMTERRGDEQHLFIRCDQETISLVRDTETWRVHPPDEPMACKRVLAEKAGKDPDAACKCDLEANLRFLYPAFRAAANLPFGYFQLGTGSWHDDTELYGGLGFIQQNWAEPIGRTLNEVPLTIYREERQIRYQQKGQNKTKQQHVIRVTPTDAYIEEYNAALANVVRIAPPARATPEDDWADDTPETDFEYPQSPNIVSGDDISPEDPQTPPATQEDPVADENGFVPMDFDDDGGLVPPRIRELEAERHAEAPPSGGLDTAPLQELAYRSFQTGWEDHYNGVRETYGDKLKAERNLSLPPLEALYATSEDVAHLMARYLRTLAICEIPIIIPSVKTVATRNGGTFHIITVGGVDITFGSREPFREAGYPKDVIDAMEGEGETVFARFMVDEPVCYIEANVNRNPRTSHPKDQLRFELKRVIPVRNPDMAEDPAPEDPAPESI